MLHILNKHLTNERAWLRTESLGAIDAKYKHGARMAKERIPQLEKAIELISRYMVNQSIVHSKPAIDHRPKNHRPSQLNLFK